MSEKTRIVIDASELNHFCECPFKWKAIHQYNLRLRNEPTYFDKGSLLHFALEKYYIQKRDGMGSFAEMVESIVDESRIHAIERYPELRPDEISEIIFQFREYCTYYENENWIPLHVEEPFIKEFYEDDSLQIYIAGKPDLIYKYPGQDSRAGADHKRMSRNTDYSPLRNQFMLYSYALGLDTFVVNKVGFQKTKSPRDRFLRQSFTYHPEIMEEWRIDTINKVKELVLAVEENYFPRNRTSCEKFGLCSLHKYCATRQEAREFLIGSEYLVGEPWDVTKVLEVQN